MPTGHHHEELSAAGDRAVIRPLAREDGEEFTARARESRALHHPWLFPPTTPEAWAEYADRVIEDPARRGFLVCEPDGSLAGYITISNIVAGAFRNGTLGYGAFAHAAGRGLMSEGLALVVAQAFGPLGLHRLEINVQPRNTASIALARRTGFRLEGYSPDFLHVDGAWRDHERWARTAAPVRRETAVPAGRGGGSGG
ncbi:GNAT family N-acetyltransferase [Streptomyces sp. NPDC058045]|uniref:GNAT family N-acetyltransferase n=1 Tax=Streptomyces sp. NPDC058045 TaxID=3346311 RepID=UPI0036EEA58D